MKVSTFIDFANISNQIIDLWSKGEDGDLCRICSMMEWELLKSPYADCTFDKLFAVIPESIYKADHINIAIRERYGVSARDVAGCVVDCNSKDTVVNEEVIPTAIRE